ncbi:MAG: 4Fe-4S binding protein [Bacteroidota bacterium]
MTRQDSIGNNIHKTGVRSHLQTNKFPVADAALCIGCGACVAECLSGAIVLENKKAKINTDKCIKCMACINACPTEAIL